MCPNADLASCIVIAADLRGLAALPLYKAILRAEWAEERDISSETTLREILTEQKLDSTTLLREGGAPEVVQRYGRYTDEAVGAGVFGSPSYVYRNELFWGQDRLDMLEDAIASI